MRTARPARQSGLSLIETCIAASIACTLLGTAIPSFKGTLERRQLEGVASELATDIAYVRSEAVARNQQVRLSFYVQPEGSCYVVHTGSAANCSCAPSGAAQCVGGAVALKSVLRPAGSVAVRANVASMLFDPVRGTASPAGTVRVSGGSKSIQHVVNIMGRVRSCSPDGAVAGYKAC